MLIDIGEIKINKRNNDYINELLVVVKKKI